jgi:hypothetical protein
VDVVEIGSELIACIEDLQQAVTALHVFQKGQMTFALVGIVYAAIEMHTT